MYEKLVIQKSCRQPKSSVTIRRFHKRKSCCNVIAISQAGIAALTEMQGFKKECSVHLFSHFYVLRLFCVYFYSMYWNPSAIRTQLRWLKGACDNYLTTPDTTLAYQNAIFKPNKWEKSSRGLCLIAVACVTFAWLASIEWCTRS